MDNNFTLDESGILAIHKTHDLETCHQEMFSPKPNSLAFFKAKRAATAS